MADGTTKKIEDVREGDLVLSRNIETGVVEARRVLAHTVKLVPQVLTLTLTDPTTHLTQNITCTPGHPFYVQGRGFVLAGDLGIGTSIVTRAGPCLSVEAIKYEPKSASETLVYNFTVENDHTYFVGTLNGGTWVHNTSSGLLYAEGDVDTYGSLRAAGTTGDNVTPHHMPSNAYMEGRGIPGYHVNKGIAMNMEQPHPGTGGRHRQTDSYGVSPDMSVDPRTALGREIKNVRQIYQRDGLYSPTVRRSLQRVIRMNKAAWPGHF